jgi:hypothetical protein
MRLTGGGGLGPRFPCIAAQEVPGFLVGLVLVPLPMRGEAEVSGDGGVGHGSRL